MDRGPNWMDYAAVAVGGGLGSVLRYGTSLLVNRFGEVHQAHWATLIVNLIGCLLIGTMAGLLSAGHHVGERWELLLRVGVLGGLTTFSTFSLDFFVLASTTRWRTAVIYAVANVMGGLLLLVMGYLLARLMSGTQS